MDVRLKRVYEPAASEDGYRVLIDRLWPRGVSRERAQLDEWERALPPSSQLRQWFGHEPSRFEEFRQRYLEELRNERPRIARLRRRARDGTLTLVYAARDTEHNDAIVLAEVLRRGLPIVASGSTDGARRMTKSSAKLPVPKAWMRLPSVFGSSFLSQRSSWSLTGSRFTLAGSSRAGHRVPRLLWDGL